MGEFYADRRAKDGLQGRCRDCCKADARDWNVSNRDRHRANQTAYYRRNVEERRKRNRVNEWVSRWRLRQEAIAAYGGKCACCGEDTYEFLAIDHVKGGGTAHRREIGNSYSFHKWIRDSGYPDSLRVLCHNCNAAEGFYGYCPHRLLPLVRRDAQERAV